MKIAVTTCACQGPFESLAVMLEAAGYDLFAASPELVDLLKHLGCQGIETVDVSNRREGTGLTAKIIGPEGMDACDLFVDVKVQNYGTVTKSFPRLRNKYLWYRINGGRPSEDWELNPPCTVLTPNLWYRENKINHDLLTSKDCDCGGDTGSCPICDGGLGWCIRCKDGEAGLTGKHCKTYTMWPPFVRANAFSQPRKAGDYGPPVCLVHNIKAWIGPEIVEAVRPLGVRMYGWRSPDGIVQNSSLPGILSSALAYVHLKNTDAPGYALFEAMSAGCPVICSRQFIEGNRMQELLEPGKTCLEYHFSLASEADSAAFVIDGLLGALKNPERNKRIGTAGRERLQSLLWRADRDGPGFAEWIRRNFPC